MSRRAAVMVAAAIGMTACGGSDAPSPTSGPLESMVHIGPTAVQVYAYRHRLALESLPIDAPLGLPITGPIELDANLSIPLRGLAPELRGSHGKAAVRCVGRCRLGDDRTPVVSGGDGAFASDVPFSHVDLDGLEVDLVVRRGVVRVTRWTMPSPELETQVRVEVRLAREPDDSAVDGCVRVRATAALAARDPRLHALLQLVGAPDGDGWLAVRISGTIGAPRRIAVACDASIDG